MTFDDMLKQYIQSVVENHLQSMNNNISTEQLHNVIGEFLADNDYMTRDDVNEQINGATVYVEASLSA
jgi:hypothetical protein